MIEWRLRRASVEDAPAVALLAGASFLATFAGVLDGADIVAHVEKNSSTTRFADWLSDPASVVVLGEHAAGYAPIGYTLLTPPDLPIDIGDGDIELRRIYTLPLAHKTGLGQALMSRAIDDARAMRKDRVLLGVLGSNARARAFYERQGFSIVGRRLYQVGSAFCDDVIYGRSIRAVESA